MKALSLFSSRHSYLKYIALILTLLVIYTLTHGSQLNLQNEQIQQQQQQQQQQQPKDINKEIPPPPQQQLNDQHIQTPEKIETPPNVQEIINKEEIKDYIKQSENLPNPIKDTHQSSSSEITDITNKININNNNQIFEQSSPQKSEKVKATFVTLARNSELYDLIKSIRTVEDRFNRNYNYDWVFLNDEEFTQEFKDLTSSIVSGKTKYGKIPQEHWSYPDFIDLKKAEDSRKNMKQQGIIYGDSESYRHMCRYESGFFWRSELLKDYEYYWRVEPGIDIMCDLNYDLFKFMKDNNKLYGFTISIHEFEKTIPSLWEHTKKFINDNPQYLAQDNFMDFISDDKGKTYNLCHFWTNFEIASLNFWKSEAYTKYFDYLDSTGGFFYERWGDAPIHSIAISLFTSKQSIHYFDDVGYRHGVYGQCPLNAQFRYDKKCHCKADDDFTFRGYSCGKKYFDKMGLKKPDEWESYQ
ncbi:KRE2 [Candida jiufengensis]|uniref:KRE2 n=1 Tax=Candida jiufengensis TaxID=497108 RepID=UPI0022252BE6|nr:KRE2 [Candida jiufengensis]KAI5953137.1 KRE2 [Candida jiufengensis]